MPAARKRPAGFVSAFVILFAALSCDPPANSSADDTAVDPSIRLADYLKYSQFPESSRPAGMDSPDLEELRPARGKSEGAAVAGWGEPRIEKGSLVIPFVVEVRQAGRFAFSTVVERPGQGKFAVLTHDADLTAGRHTLSFLLFGKIIRDADYASPLLIRGIAGERTPTDAELDAASRAVTAPPEGRLPLFKENLKISGFAVSSFSRAEWDSPEKQRRISELRAEIEAKQKRP